MTTDEYYSYADIDATGANYRIVIGERSNGKTFGFKIKAIDNYFETGAQCAYVRRRAEEVKPATMAEFWTDTYDVIISHMRDAGMPYTGCTVQARSGSFILYGIDDDLNKINLGSIGCYYSLVNAHYRKSSSTPDINIIGYDEFLTEYGELDDEWSRFLNLVSTIKRKRTDMTVYLMANTVCRQSKTLQSIGIDVRELTPGQIRMYRYETMRDGQLITNTVAVEYCRHYAQSTDSESFFVFGTRREMMIRQGEWEIDDYPKYTETDFYKAVIAIAYILESGQSRVYLYMSQNTQYFASNRRLIYVGRYITITDRMTAASRMQFNFSDKRKSVRRIITQIRNAVQTGMVAYDTNFTGDDVQHIIDDWR